MREASRGPWADWKKPAGSMPRARRQIAKPAYCAVARKLLVLLNASVRTHNG